MGKAIQGECLCGEVTFEIHQLLGNGYQCYCSLCRKVSGSHANSATLVNQECFNWLSGQHFIHSYQKPTGFRSDFCCNCGSVLPNPISGAGLMWIPMGLLNENDNLENSCISVQVYEASKANWDKVSDNCYHFAQNPSSIEDMINLLKRGK